MTLQNNSKGVFELLFKDFGLVNVCELFKFSIRGRISYSGILPINYEQCIFIIYDPAGREKTKQIETTMKIN